MGEAGTAVPVLCNIERFMGGKRQHSHPAFRRRGRTGPASDRRRTFSAHALVRHIGILSRPLVLFVCAACTPALNWRELRVDGSALRVMLPCKPSVFARQISIADHSVQWTVLTCRAGESTWSVGYGAAPEADATAKILAALGRGDVNVTLMPWPSAAIEQTAGAARRRWVHESPERVTLQGEDLLFSHGNHAFRVSVTGPRVDPEAAQFFFASVGLRR